MISEDGWRIIGGCTHYARASLDNGNIGIIYEYEQGCGYKRVTESESIEPGKGYWILINNIVDLAVLTVKAVE